MAFPVSVYTVCLRVIELNRRFIHLKLKSILAHGIGLSAGEKNNRDLLRVGLLTRNPHTSISPQN